jgi:hypothetical protein
MTADQYPVSIISWPPRAMPDGRVDSVYVMRPDPKRERVLTIGDLTYIAHLAMAAPSLTLDERHMVKDFLDSIP